MKKNEIEMKSRALLQLAAEFGLLSQAESMGDACEIAADLRRSLTQAVEMDLLNGEEVDAAERALSGGLTVESAVEAHGRMLRCHSAMLRAAVVDAMAGIWSDRAWSEIQDEMTDAVGAALRHGAIVDRDVEEIRRLCIDDRPSCFDEPSNDARHRAILAIMDDLRNREVTP